MRIITLLVAAVLILSSCASAPGKNDKFVDASFPIKNQLYGLLENTVNGYRFTKIANSIDKTKMEPWVDLKQGLPTWNYRNVVCGKDLILKDAATDCRPLPENLFLVRKIDKKNQVRRIIASPFLLGTTLAGVTLEQFFDVKNYNLAITNAKKNVDVNIIQKIDSSITDTLQAEQSARSTFRSAIDSGKKYVTFKINDKTGAYDNSLVLTDAIRVYEDSSQCKSSFELENNDNVVSAVAKHGAEYLNCKKVEYSSISSRCDNRKIKGVSYSIACPDRFTVINDKLTGNVKITIEGIEKYKVLPYDFALNDANLKLTMKDRHISFENLSNKFIQVDSIAFYYSNKVAMYNQSIQLAPLSSLLSYDYIPLTRLSIDWGLLNFQNVTRNTLQQLLTFGFAIKYRIVDTNQEKTLMKTNNYKIHQLESLSSYY